MASVTLDIDVNKAIKGLEGEVSELLKKADRKFAVAGARAETYAKAAAPVNKKPGIGGFHRRNIRHVKDGFLSVSLQAAADYASVLEFGFNGVVDVSAHTRDITQAFGREIPLQTVNVRAHSRQMNRPARPHIVPAAERALKQLVDDLEGLKV